MIRLKRKENKCFSKNKNQQPVNEPENLNYDFKLANLESKYTSMKEAKEYYEKNIKIKRTNGKFVQSIVSNQYNIESVRWQ